MGVVNPILDNHSSAAMLGAEIILPALQKKPMIGAVLKFPTMRQ
jgi:hypothetical protein